MGLIWSLYFAAHIHLLIQQALAVRPRGVAKRIVAYSPWLTGGLLVGVTVVIVYYLSSQAQRGSHQGCRFDSEPRPCIDPQDLARQG
ncbi:MAG: hypothetical protein ABSF15_16030 [Candidatus Sulfotelmatobacter sp.]|jgi:hypothetical protein